MSVLEKLGIEISHDKEYLNEALGISNERAGEIFKVVKETYDRNDRLSMVVRDLLSRYDGAEAIFAIFILGVKIGTRKTIEKFAAKLMFRRGA